MGPLIQESLWLLNICGMNPLNKSNFSRFIGVVFIMTFSVFVFEIFMTLIFNWNGLDSIDVLSQSVVGYQITIKMIIFFIHRKKVANLLSRIEMFFWPLDKYGFKLERVILKGYGQMKKIFICTFAAGFIAIATYSIKPLFSSQRMLPYALYHPSDLTRSDIYVAMYVFEVTVPFIVSLPGVMGIDFLFFSIIIYIVNELRMLKKGFSSIRMDGTLKDNKVLEEIVPLINHHVLILGCIKDLNETFSIVLLNEIIGSTFAICASMLGTISDGFPPDLQHIIKPIPNLITFSSLSLLHCIAGTFLITETQNVADAVFESKWWLKTQPNIRRALTLVIQRAQKTEKLSGGGMFDIDLLTFTNVVRTAFSFTTLAQTLFAKTK